MSKNPLQQQLEDRRFAHAADYVENSAQSLKKLTTSELQQLNQMLTGEDGDAWRFTPVSITIPGGHTHHFNVHNNPIVVARKLIADSEDMAANGEIKAAGAHIYIELVKTHLFNEANRRTGVLALKWILNSHGVAIDHLQLLKISIGNLRDAKDAQDLKDKILNLR